MLKALSPSVRQYLLITGNYWAFTPTDGALRMLVILHFHSLGYGPLDIALLFIFYEFFGVVTNLIGGWLGAIMGLNKTMNLGLVIQVAALSMLLVPNNMLTIPWVMFAQALSGIAKDLNKMSAKSAIKVLVPDNSESKLFHWVALLTGSKNALKGIGFFLGGAMLTIMGFTNTIAIMVIFFGLICISSILLLRQDLGKANRKPKFTELFSKSEAINRLSLARLFLFGARDIWFVIAIPVYLSSHFGWQYWSVGAFMSAWVIAYGFIQSTAPLITGVKQGRSPDGKQAFLWSCALAFVPAFIALAINQNFYPEPSLLLGLMIYGFFFAVNSSVHSFLIINYANEDQVSLDVGFYYMANAMGRLLGTILSGWLYQYSGMEACLLVSAAFILLSSLISLSLPRHA